MEEDKKNMMNNEHLYKESSKTDEILSKTKEEVEKIIEQIIQSDLQPENVEILGKIIDIHKDIMNENYWKEKINMYRDSYNNYNDYNDGSYGRRRRDSRGRYMGNSYGRRGYDTKYRGEDMMEQMHQAYNDYMDEAEYGNYGTSESMMKIEIMADSLIDFIHHIKKEAKTPEERQLIDQKLQEIGRM